MRWVRPSQEISTPVARLPSNVSRVTKACGRRHPTTLIFLAFDGDQPVGAAVCFIGFSTFAAKPLINIHDLVVLPTSRGKGIGRQLLEAVEAKARELGCCKLTLEVMDKNHQAVHMYQAAGFERYALQEEAGAAIFMSKPLQ